MYARRESDARSDVDLLCLAKGGDSAALDALMARHVEALLRYCRTLTPNSHDAEDLCQEAMTRAIDRLHSLESGEAFRTWLFRVARNLAVDWSRRGQRLQPMPDGDGASFPSPESGPHERVETSEEHEMVAQALQTLKQRHRDVLLLREVEGLSYADIARRLNVSQSAVENTSLSRTASPAGAVWQGGVRSQHIPGSHSRRSSARCRSSGRRSARRSENRRHRGRGRCGNADGCQPGCRPSGAHRTARRARGAAPTHRRSASFRERGEWGEADGR